MLKPGQNSTLIALFQEMVANVRFFYLPEDVNGKRRFCLKMIMIKSSFELSGDDYDQR